MLDGPVVEPGAVDSKVGCGAVALLACVGYPTLLVTWLILLLTVSSATTLSYKIGLLVLAAVGWFGTYRVVRGLRLEGRRLARCLAWAALGLPFVAVILVFALLRGRMSANESRAVVVLRTLQSSQGAYKGATGEFAPTTACLVRPSSCVPSYRGPAFLEEAHAAEDASGYIYKLVTWPHPPKTVDAYCYKAWPRAINHSGTRSFGGDSSGVLAGTMGSANCCREDGTLSAECPKLN